MAIPTNAYVYEEQMDPEDVKEYKADAANDPDGSPILQSGELIDTFTLVPGPEAVALGVEMGTSDYASIKSDGDQSVTFWPMVNSSFWDNASFADEGVQLPFELTINTNSTPARRHQKTLVIRIAQQ